MPAELPKHAGRHEPRHRRPVPELAVIIGSPAVHARARTRRNGAGVVQTCRGDAQAEGASGHRRRQLGQRRVITDLTAAVGTPAVSDAGGRNAAGVVPAAAHDGEHDPALHGGGHQLVNCRVIAQLSVPVAAPAVRRAGRRYSAGVRVPCLHGREGHRSRGTCLTVEAGYAHTCAVTSAGAAYCWGGNGNAQQYAAPADVTAQVCAYPASTVAKVTAAGAPAWTGVGLSTVVL